MTFGRKRPMASSRHKNRHVMLVRTTRAFVRFMDFI
jgi:hypothetical protein